MFRKKVVPTLPPEWLIVGLGNPGPEYRGTRHNVGFDLIDRLANRFGIKVSKAKHRAQIGLGDIDGHTVLLAKPLTYMNLSGQAIAPLMRENGLKPDRVLVIADEMAIPTGVLRLREKGSAAGHNGHKSIIASLGTDQYPRLRIGIGKSADDQIDHVLGSFGPHERVDIEKALHAGEDVCRKLIDQGVEAAQRVVEEFNRTVG